MGGISPFHLCIIIIIQGTIHPAICSMGSPLLCDKYSRWIYSFFFETKEKSKFTSYFIFPFYWNLEFDFRNISIQKYESPTESSRKYSSERRVKCASDAVLTDYRREQSSREAKRRSIVAHTLHQNFFRKHYL